MRFLLGAFLTTISSVLSLAGEKEITSVELHEDYRQVKEILTLKVQQV